ncbi:hypothetical protein [Nocardia sp. CA-119907]|uniref:VMAP-C domain-containing protein n=1 Tax=Nocardia sp. CA-119907 TaxID=3239973 RepID=UPI003D985DF3
MRTFDPDRVLVIAIGIDEYRQSAMRLSGAAAYAERFAKWALGQGVPAKNILLACSDTDSMPDPLSGIRRWEPAQASIIDLLKDAAGRSDPERSGPEEPDLELLLMYWCGHGVLKSGRKRALFTSDAESGALRVHVVEEIRNYLSSTTVKGLDSQIIFIDACADFYNEMHLNERLVKTTLNIGNPKRVRQYVLHSTSEGQSAYHDNITRSNVFSDTVFQWLDTMPPGPLTPNIGTLNAMVTARFDLLRAADGPEQTPVWQVDDTGGTSYTLPTMFDQEGVEGIPFRYFESSYATLLEWWMDAQSFSNAEGSMLPDIREQLIAALPNDAVKTRDDNLDATELVARVFSTNQVARLFEILQSYATTASLKIGLTKLGIQWSQDLDIARVEQHFPNVTNQMVANAYWRSMLSIPADSPLCITAALRSLVGLSEREGQKPLHRFVADLEKSAKRTVPDQWFRLSSGQLKALRRDAGVSHIENRRLVIDILSSQHDLNRFESPFAIGVHCYRPGKGWVHKQPEGTLTLAEVRSKVNQLLAGGADKCVLGFRVPRAAFDEIPESWEFSDDFTAPISHWCLRPTLLHSAERMRNPRLWSNWMIKHPRIRTRLDDHPDDLLAWIERTEPETVHSLVSSSESACIGMAFAPAVNGFDLHQDPLMAAIVAGAPYILWSTYDGDNPTTTRQQVKELVTGGPFDELPARLQYRRQNAVGERQIAVRLLWDDPDLLPPQPNMLGMQGGCDD